MRKLLSCVLCLHFLVISLLPNSDVMELFKLNNLLSHFTHHQVVEKQEIGFLEFLFIHYLDKRHQHTDCQEHNELPFHNTGQQTATNIHFFFTTPSFFSWDFKVHYIEMLDSQIATYQDNYFPSFHLSIWQPPKSA